jgi:hypothetical protein
VISKLRVSFVVEEWPLVKCNFEKFLLEAVDESLSSLGESSKQSIYYHLDSSFSIKKQEIPDKLEAFTAALEKIFGLGANLIENLIMKRLTEKVELGSKWNTSRELTLVEYVNLAKQSFLEERNADRIEVETAQCKQLEQED